jgi:CHAT domain-containing protein/tetratricopeptide (TPR) repeat protein
VNRAPLLAAIFAICWAASADEPPAKEVGVKELVATASALYDARKYNEALTTFEKAQALAAAAGDALGVAHAKMGIGWIRLMRNDVDAAIALAEEARATFEAAGDRENTAQALYQLASLHIGVARVTIGRDLLQKALPLAESDRLRGDVLQRLGATEASLGHHREAMDILREAITFAEQRGLQHTVAASYHAMARVHTQQGNLDLAAFYEEKTLAISRERKSSIMASQSLNNLASIYDMKGDFARAISLYRENLALMETLKYARGMIITRLNIAGVLLHERRYDEAEGMIAEVLRQLETFNNPTSRSQALRDRADIREHRGDDDGALQDALDAAKEGAEDWRTVHLSQTLVGHLYRKLGRNTEARTTLDRAIRLIETTRAEGSGEEVHFFDQQRDAYVEMAALLVSEGDVNGALAYVERYRSRVLIDLLRSLPADRSRVLSAAELARERELVERLSKLQSEASRASTAELEERLTTARREYDAFQHDLVDAHPRLRVERGTLEPVPLAEAASRLPADAVLVEYLVSEEKTYAFVIGGGASPRPPIDVRVLDVSRDELARRAQSFHDLLARRRPDFRRDARALHQTLIAPIADLLATRRTWILIPDGPLWNLPFQALVDEQGRYAAERAAIVYAPAIAAWVEMSRPAAASPQRARRELLAFGNPATAAGAGAGVGAERTRARLAPLPEAETEVRSAARFYGPGSSAVYVRDEATEARFKAEASRYRVLHLAGHGVLNDASPMHSYLLLATRDHDGEDGFLEAGELMQMDLGAELVVLSACETARGGYAEGEGIIGFSWALFAARCRTQVVSQWKVDSAATSLLMRTFHRNVRADRRGAATALRKSVASMLATKEYRHPFYWAGFVVLGDAR